MDRSARFPSRILILVALSLTPLIRQPVLTNVFPPAEFAARRAEVMKAIGDSVAILQGTTERPGEQPFRQSNQFFYLTGVVEPRGLAKDRVAIYTSFRPEVLWSASSFDTIALARATKNDESDRRSSREEAFREKLTTVSPQSEIRDLDPILDRLSGVKSPPEIAVIRETTRITGLAIIEAMRDARPGMYEFELQAGAIWSSSITLPITRSTHRTYPYVPR